VLAGGGHEREGKIALTKAELGQQIAEEAREAADSAEHADEQLEQVEYAVLLFNAVLTVFLFGGVYMCRRDYNIWLERKKELGRAWQAVQRAGMVAPGTYPSPGDAERPSGSAAAAPANAAAGTAGSAPSGAATGSAPPGAPPAGAQTPGSIEIATDY